jgi:hypothetical protein
MQLEIICNAGGLRSLKRYKQHTKMNEPLAFNSIVEARFQSSVGFIF